MAMSHISTTSRRRRAILELGLTITAALLMLLPAPAQGQVPPLGGRVIVVPPPITNPLPVTATDKYDPRNKDWASVAAACLAAGQQEKRLYNFFTRASFHDSMAVYPLSCTSCSHFAAGQ